MKQLIVSFARWSPRRRRPAILCLHDVGSRAWFEGFARELAARVEIVPLEPLVAGRDDRPARPQAALTFDDGCRSVATIVEPVASALGLPFTMFVCGEVMEGGPAPWPDRVMRLAGALRVDRAAALWGWRGGAIPDAQGLVNRLKELPHDRIVAGLERGEADLGDRLPAPPLEYLGVAEVRRLATNPLVTIGSHSHRHPILARLSHAEQVADLERGVAALERASGRRPRLFAYPNGKATDYDAGTIQTLRELGIIAAVTTDQRPLGRHEDPYRLPRLGISAGDSLTKLELKWSLPWPSRGDRQEAVVRKEARTQWPPA
ncbi:MAG TPA: polysaccharide deacetylase family protein [Gemmatimonadales bacterium]|nr:polysaccharide deacetylase family protein [Gemmatimonadales bacterium]